MFSRAAKSIVKIIGQRKYHAGEENIKVTLTGGAGEIGRSLSQMLKQTSKFNVLALYDAASLNNRFANSWMLTMMDKSPIVPRHRTMREPVVYLTNGPSNVAKNETDELVEVLRRLPIAEEATVNPLGKSKMAISQGDNGCFGHGILRGPRVLGEMGSDKTRQASRIATEIYKQLPDLVDRLGRDRTKRGNRPALRQLSTFTMSAEKPSPEDLDPAGNVGEVPATSTVDASNKKKPKNARKPSSLEKSPAKDLARTDRKIALLRTSKDRKGSFQESSKLEKRVSNGKSRNWTIPAALSDKKPKLLYGLVQQRRSPIAWFFSSLFESQNSVAFPDVRSVRQRGSLRKCETNRERVDPAPRILEEDSQEISASATSPAGESVGKSETLQAEGEVKIVEESRSMIDGSSLPQDLDEARQTAAPSSSYETVSELSESPRALRSISSKLWQFLENLRTGRRKSSSASSLSSYHLDAFFEERAPLSKRVDAVRFFSKSFHSKRRSLDRTKSAWPKHGSEKAAKKNDSSCGSEKAAKKKDSSCDSGNGDPCMMPESLYGARCKKMEADCGRAKDVCKKYRKEEVYGASCKGGQDPCKKTRDEKVYGKMCKEFEDEFGGEDPLDGFWKEKVHGQRCKKKSSGKVCGNPKCGDKKCKEDPCGKSKPSPCGKEKPDPCGKSKPSPCGKEKSDPCGKKPEPCGKKPEPCGKKPDPCGKKPDPCGKKPDPCGKKPEPCGKKPDPCGIKEPDPCGKEKPDPCGKEKPDPCGKQKKPDPCGKKKPDPCGKKKPDPCGKKKPDPCGKKKPDPCGKKKPDPCGKKKPVPCGKKAESSEKKGKGDCPPVFRAPQGCPKDEKGSGGKDSSRKYSTYSRLRVRSSFSCKQDILRGFPRIIDGSSMPELGPRKDPRRIYSLNPSAVNS